MKEVRSHLPLFETQIKSHMANPPFAPFGREDALVLTLVKWFKNDFMRWVDPIMCPACGGSTSLKGGDEPNAQERLDGAGRVELHECLDTSCKGMKRFSRYGSVRKLLETREGRCGESELIAPIT